MDRLRGHKVEQEMSKELVESEWPTVLAPVPHLLRVGERTNQGLEITNGYSQSFSIAIWVKEISTLPKLISSESVSFGGIGIG